jgi:hypothetical protein
MEYLRINVKFWFHYLPGEGETSGRVRFHEEAGG